MMILAILVKATAVLAFAVLAHLLAVRRAAAAARHLLWTLVVVGLLALPLLVAVTP